MPGAISEKLLQFLQDPSPNFLTKNPDLLGPAANAELRKALNELRSKGHHQDVAQIEDCLKLFYLCKKIGIKKAFDSHKSRLTVDPDLRSFASSARKTALHATQERLPDLAQKAWEACRQVVYHNKFTDAYRDFQFTALQNAISAALHLWQVTQDPSSLNTGISLGSRALEIGDPKSNQYSLLLTTLTLVCEHSAEGSQDSFYWLSRALPYYEQALSLAPKGSQGLRVHKCNYARVLRKCSDLGGPLSFLDRGIDLLTEVLDEATENTDRDTAITLLSNSLQSRYERSGSFSTLDQSIHLVANHLSAKNELTSAHAAMCNNLGTAYLERGERLKKRTDLEEARKYLEMALGLESETSSSRASRLLNLGNCLAQLAGNAADSHLMQEARRQWEEGLAIAAPGSREETGLLLAMMSQALEEFEVTADRAKAAKVTGLSERILKSSYARPHDHSIALLRKGHAHYSIYEKTFDLVEAKKAMATFAQAMDLDNPFPLLAHMARQGYIEIATRIGDWAEAAKAGQALGYLHEKMMTVQPGVHKLALLRQFRGSHLSLAYSLVQLGSFAEAVEILEAGQIRYFSELLADKALFGDMPLPASEEIEAIKLARSAVQKELQHSKEQPGIARPAELDSALIQLARMEEALRTNTDLKTFKSRPKIGEIQTVATAAPIVYIFSTHLGGMTMIVDGQGIRHLPLPSFSHAALIEGAIKHPDGHPGFLVTYSVKEHFAAVGLDWRSYLVPYLEWIWRTTVRPILDFFGNDLPDEIVVIPCGFAGLLPFHAAFDQAERDHLIDRVRIRYSLSSEFARISKTSSDNPTISVIGIRDPKLVGIDAEVACIQNIFGSRCHRLFGEGLQAEEVFSSMAISDIFHFTGHARALVDEPLRSHLHLGGDSFITLRRLLDHYFPKLRLAVLSSCETALVGTDIVEEGLGLPGGFLQAGAAGVIASSWQASDRSAPFLVSRLYWLIECCGRPPAQALREAQIWLRDSSRTQLLEWARSEEEFTKPLQKIALGDSDYPFSDPFHWAAFAYFGA